ncbi:malto-oligosyltrehalose trehalohydrolase [Nonomuraea sp. KC401]|uniref:malto-oligosyltrehalose trehalohydrolase n=1 Tax=unclassified Nonomuraea TaxID=2593643 RepID=UPI0010FEDCF8|nr:MULTISPECIES: malto-oligosyltrehalose trehalohydrolase [unclassified Nonomuraea]NBE94154.1 malto-oligosyltrehalose trehalohydrolase [Nonomuraea sp. K271]TLF66095.1 malto-oligosyltrehalose trehalohydrolase [Nonomuraea sp. KC401]
MIFEVWAPKATAVEVEVMEGRRAMSPGEGGWWSADVPEAGHGTAYGFVVDGGGPYPDPRSRRQPEGVFGQSAVYDHGRFTWSDHDWKGRDLRGAVIYELHVGTFTPEGTFAAAAEKLEHLAELCVDFVELMPVAPVPGGRNWGYDGVDLYAVNETYGGPDGLKTFVDACHRAGIGVILDVVYNHLGPSGNFLRPFGPYFAGFEGSYWGEAVNLDGPGSDEVRRYFIGNALQWLRDFHIDGLRLDAVHALHDKRAKHLLAELSEEVDALACSVGRPLFLIAESDLNDPRMVRAPEAGGLGMTAQWDDDVHHALHCAVSGESHGYYQDFARLPALAKVLTSGVLHDGTYSTFRGRAHGRSYAGVPGHRLVACLQNHDQIGNRPQGDRLPIPALKLGAGLLLTSPFTPMLFMGEEWGARSPFLFFSDHVEPHLRETEAERREREFVGFWPAWDAPDPSAEETFLASKLDWSEVKEEAHWSLLCWYRDLIALRKALPELSDPRLDRVRVETDPHGAWLIMWRGSLAVLVNFTPDSVTLPLTPGTIVLASDEPVTADGEGVRLPGQSLLICRPPAYVRTR